MVATGLTFTKDDTTRKPQVPCTGQRGIDSQQQLLTEIASCNCPGKMFVIESLSPRIPKNNECHLCPDRVSTCLKTRERSRCKCEQKALLQTTRPRELTDVICSNANSGRLVVTKRGHYQALWGPSISESSTSLTSIRLLSGASEPLHQLNHEKNADTYNDPQYSVPGHPCNHGQDTTDTVNLLQSSLYGFDQVVGR